MAKGIGSDVVKYLTGRKMSCHDLANHFHTTNQNMASMLSYHQRHGRLISSVNYGTGLLEYTSVITTPAPQVDLGFSIESLSNQIVSQVMVAVVEELERRLVELPINYDAIMEKIKQHRAQEEKKSRLPRIGVVGLLPKQSGELAMEFADCLDIRFWKDESTDKLRQMADHCEVIFLHTQHSGHNVDEILKNTSTPLRRVKGGVTAMSRAIEEFFCNRLVTT